MVCREAVIWKDLSHRNVLPLLGVSDSKPPYMLSEWMKNGDLRNYLEKSPHPNRLSLVGLSALI
jgi:serine/threonine protein kinase